MSGVPLGFHKSDIGQTAVGFSWATQFVPIYTFKQFITECDIYVPAVVRVVGFLGAYPVEVALTVVVRQIVGVQLPFGCLWAVGLHYDPAIAQSVPNVFFIAVVIGGVVEIASRHGRIARVVGRKAIGPVVGPNAVFDYARQFQEIGRASCRERV